MQNKYILTTTCIETISLILCGLSLSRPRFHTGHAEKKCSHSCLLAMVLAFLSIDGKLYERWRHVLHLRNLQKSWVLDGSPYPAPDPRKYGYSNSGTAYVYAASQVIGGQSYGGLFAYRPNGESSVFVITTNGVPLVIGPDGSARLVWIHKTRGAAW